MGVSRGESRVNRSMRSIELPKVEMIASIWLYEYFYASMFSRMGRGKEHMHV